MQSITTCFQHDVSKDMPATVAIVGAPNQTDCSVMQNTSKSIKVPN
jgi:hypothetical protein